MASKKQDALQYEFLHQIVMSGDSGVGKTALLHRFAQPNRKWDDSEHIATIGVDYAKKVVKVEDRNVLVQTWDTAGQERFRTITMAYYRGAQGALICYDCTHEETLASARDWIKDFRERSNPNTPVILVACKQDLLESSQEPDTQYDSMLPVANVQA